MKENIPKEGDSLQVLRLGIHDTIDANHGIQHDERIGVDLAEDVVGPDKDHADEIDIMRELGGDRMKMLVKTNVDDIFLDHITIYTHHNLLFLGKGWRLFGFLVVIVVASFFVGCGGSGVVGRRCCCCRRHSQRGHLVKK